MKTGIELIADERARQLSQEGWTAEHDDEHSRGQLQAAARCYLTKKRYNHGLSVPHGWPWDAVWFKQSSDPIRNLVKAGALIAAEIDRLQRKEGGK